MKKQIFHILLAALAGVIVFISVLLIMDIPVRITTGNQAQLAIQMLAAMRPPMLAMEKTEANPAQTEQNASFEQSAQTLRDLVTRYLNISQYNQSLHERVTQFSTVIEHWLNDEKQLWAARSSLGNTADDPNALKNLQQQYEAALGEFLQALDVLALGEKPIHHDIDQGRDANTVLQILVVGLILYLLVLIITFQRISKKALLSSYQQIQEARRNLAEREEYLSLTLASIGDGVIATDARGRVTRMNPIAEQLTGWSSEDAQGQPLKTVFHIVNAFSREPVADPVEKVLSSGQIVGLANHTVLIAKGGREFQIADSGAPICDDSDIVLGVILVFRDVTEEYRLQAEITAHRDELEQRVTERTQELESFSYAVSHDLRAPLRSIYGFSQALQDDNSEQLDDSGKDFLQRICSAALHMSDLIDAMLTLSQVTRKDIQHSQVDLSQAAHDISKKLQEQNTDQEIEWRITDHLLTEGDSGLLNIALENLLGNALKYSSRNSDKIRIEFDTTEQNGKPIFFIRDNGCGFDPRYTDKLFTAFQRLHGKEYEGTGVGLATVKRIIDRHQGKIWAESERGNGATFYFTLN